MSAFLERLKARADAETRPHREYYGDNAPAVIMAVKLIAAAEEIERELTEGRVRTTEARERTGWSAETLQKYGRMKLAGEELPEPWTGLQVEEYATGFWFVLNTIPEKKAAAA
jgi:hypothetical protein